MTDEELAVGIDLGTTYSCVAVLRNGKVEIIQNENGHNLTPSIVSFTEEGTEGALVGEDALNQIIKNPKKTIYSIKRLIGRNFNDEEVQHDIKSNLWTFDVVEQKQSKRPAIKIKHNKELKFYYPEEISKLVLEKLIQSARDYLGQPIQKAVITIPAYFNDSQRNATIFAAEQAGIKVLRIINEPTAASLAYGLDKKLPKKDILTHTFADINKAFKEEIISDNKSEKSDKKEKDDEEDEKYIVVFDLGGGTFDVTLLMIEDEEIFNVITTGGDSHLGGDDFNQRIIDYCLNEFCKNFNFNIKDVRKDSEAMNRLKIAAENAKIRLSSEIEVSIDIDDFYSHELLHIKLTRLAFEDLCKDLFNKLLNPLDDIISKCPKSMDSISEVVFVGGSTRMPKVKELIKNYFYDIHINDSINPDETVAYGAAIQAAKLNKQGGDILNDIILMDITPFSLGINVVNKNENEEIRNKGSLMSVVIPKGTKIPVEITKKYQTSYDYQEIINIGVYEGENIYVKDNHLLGEFKLIDLPKKKEGEVKDNVTFFIDENGILTVSAKETSQGISNSIKIINDKGFQKDEILENINKTFTPLLSVNHKEFKNYKQEMSYYYKEYNGSYNQKDKSKFIANFGQTLVSFLNTFEKKGNDTLGNKYFLYIKVLFESYKILIQLNSILNDMQKKMIIDNSKKFLEILSTFKNINYNNYIELLNLFVIDLNFEEKKLSFETQKQINELRNDILYDLVVFIMEIMCKKAELLLLNNLKFSKYNAKYLFQNCLLINDLYIKSERDLSRNLEVRNRYQKCIDKCKGEIKKINANSLVDLENLKSSDKLIENGENMNREQLLLLLDNFREAIQDIQGLNEPLTEAKISANIVKINYIFLSNTNYSDLRKLAEHSVILAKLTNQNVEKYKWYLEISSILQELRNKLEEIEKINQKDFENKCKTEHKNIFDAIKKNRKKPNIEFIKFILSEHKPNTSPLKENQTVENAWNKDKKRFLQRLSARYNPDNYPKEKDDEKLRYTIMKTISIEINAILSEFEPIKKI